MLGMISGGATPIPQYIKCVLMAYYTHHNKNV